MLDILYYIIIYPLQLIIEILFYTFYDLGIGIVLTIFIVSLFVNIGSLPMFLSAYKLQKKEKEIQAKIAAKVKSIKKNFKGSEKIIMLSTYYKQNNYHPIMSLRISLSLLLEIPFFIAAYVFFSQLDIVNGPCSLFSYWFINDLALPDNMLTINGLKINVLPILVTIINIISGEIYMKGFKFREKIQMYILAIIFLIILYNSPSRLVLYWTFNNLISLIRNLIMKIKNKNMIQYTFYVVITAVLLYFLIKNYLLFADIKIIFLIISYSVLIFFISKDIKNNKDRNIRKEENRIFVLSCIIIWMFIGILIPISLFSSDIKEFFHYTTNPILNYLLYPILQSFGMFLFWPILLYYFVNNKIRRILIYIFISFLFVGILNYILMDIKFSDIVADFEIINLDFLNKTNCLKNLFYSFFVCCFSIFLVYKKKYKFIITILLVLSITISILFVNNFVFLLKNKDTLIQKEYKNETVDKVIHLSKTGKNVLLFIIDAATGFLVPKIFEENPQLKQIYSGFVYYPNTISHYNYTNLGLPPILGGYEYIPLNLEKRDEKYKDEILEAYFVLPRIFKENKWNVNIMDIFLHLDNPWIQLSEDFYEKYDLNKCSILPNRVFDEKTEQMDLNKPFFLFSVSLFLPKILKREIYNETKYMKKSIDHFNFAKNYVFSIKNISEYVDFEEKGNNLNIIYNLMCHSHELCYFDKKNDYSLVAPYSCSMYTRYYGAHMSFFSFIGKFLEYLKDNNVYNNTKIIFVSDHGSSYGSMNSWIKYVPLLFVKDFNSDGGVKTDVTFMTNADVPLIATKDLVDNPINPFTLKRLESQKENGCYILMNGISPFWYEKNKVFQDDNEFLYVKKTPSKEISILEVLQESEIVFYKNIKDIEIKK